MKIQFRRKGNFSLRYIGPYEILERIEKVAYKIALPPRLANIHDVFIILMLRKYVSDSQHIFYDEEIDAERNLQVVTEPIEIVDRREQQLRNKVFPLVTENLKMTLGS